MDIAHREMIAHPLDGSCEGKVFVFTGYPMQIFLLSSPRLGNSVNHSMPGHSVAPSPFKGIIPFTH
jgi:hypothetical protein